MRERTHIDGHRTAVLAAPPGAPPLPTGPFEVLGRPADAIELVKVVAHTVPDLVLLDDDFGPELHLVCADMQELSSVTRVLLRIGPDEGRAFLSVVGGASSVISRGASVDDVLDAAVGVLRGESSVTGEIAARTIAEMDRLRDGYADPFDPPPVLTSTEREVLTRLAEGLDAEAIAERHAVTARLVNLHVGYAVAKLQRFHREVRVRRAREIELPSAPAPRPTGLAAT